MSAMAISRAPILVKKDENAPKKGIFYRVIIKIEENEEFLGLNIFGDDEPVGNTKPEKEQAPKKVEEPDGFLNIFGDDTDTIGQSEPKCIETIKSTQQENQALGGFGNLFGDESDNVYTAPENKKEIIKQKNLSFDIIFDYEAQIDKEEFKKEKEKHRNTTIRKSMIKILWLDTGYPLIGISDFMNNFTNDICKNRYMALNSVLDLKNILRFSTKNDEFNIVLSGKFHPLLPERLTLLENVTAVYIINSEISFTKPEDPQKIIQYFTSVKEFINFSKEKLLLLPKEYKSENLIKSPLQIDLKPDAFTMCPQAIFEYNHEFQNSSNYRELYGSMAIYLSKENKDKHESYDNECIYNLYNKYSKYAGEWKYHKGPQLFRKIFALSSYLNQLDYIYNGAEISEIQNNIEVPVYGPKIFNYFKMKTLFKNAYRCIIKKDKIALLSQAEILRDLHIHLIQVILFLTFEDYKEKAYMKIRESDKIKIYFNDLDFCIKVYLLFFLGDKSKNIGDFEIVKWNELLKISDSRVKHFIDICEEWKKIDENYDTIETLNIERKLCIIGKKEDKIASDYESIFDLLNDSLFYEKYRNYVIYFVLKNFDNGNILSADLRKLISKCTELKIIPNLVLHIENKEKIVSKEIFKNPVNIIICYNLEKYVKNWDKKQEKNAKNLCENALKFNNNESSKYIYLQKNTENNEYFTIINEKYELSRVCEFYKNEINLPEFIFSKIYIQIFNDKKAKILFEKYLYKLFGDFLMNYKKINDFEFCKRILDAIYNENSKISEKILEIINNESDSLEIQKLCYLLRNFIKQNGLAKYNGIIYSDFPIPKTSLKSKSQIFINKFIKCNTQIPQHIKNTLCEFKPKYNTNAFIYIKENEILLLPGSIFIIDEIIENEQKIIFSEFFD